MKRIILIGILILCQIAHIIASIWMLCAIIVGSDRAWKLAVSYDQLFNATTGGSEDETVSSRAGKLVKEKKWACVLCKLLDKLDKNHCKKYIEHSTNIK